MFRVAVYDFQVSNYRYPLGAHLVLVVGSNVRAVRRFLIRVDAERG